VTMRDGSWGQPCGPSRSSLIFFSTHPDRVRPRSGRLANWEPGNLATCPARLPDFQFSRLPRACLAALPALPQQRPPGVRRGASPVAQSGPLRRSRGAGMGAPMGRVGGSPRGTPVVTAGRGAMRYGPRRPH
jgi:hypothetical protein